MRKVSVIFPKHRGSAGYSILVGSGILSDFTRLTRSLQFSQAFFIVDSRLKSLAVELGRALSDQGIRVTQVAVPAREASKDYRRLFPLYAKLIQTGQDRNSLLIAVGGGVIGDLAGFVAATYLRGIRWVGVPTTLLAQVDSSVGGKTGVNHPLGKNLIGAFHQPELVICDSKCLKTLSLRDRVSGLGEIIKYGLVYDPKFYLELERRAESLLKLEASTVEWAVAKAVAWKAKIVARDEFETTGLRRTLNFGHTLGHALEGLTHYRRFRHGEAVIVGMRLALALSVEQKHLAERQQKKIDDFLRSLALPSVPVFSLEKWIEYLARDKKVKAGKVNYVLLKALGKPVVDAQVTPEALQRSFQRLGIKLR